MGRVSSVQGKSSAVACPTLVEMALGYPVSLPLQVWEGWRVSPIPLFPKKQQANTGIKEKVVMKFKAKGREVGFLTESPEVSK